MSLIYWPQIAGPLGSNLINHDPYFSSVVMLAHLDGTNGQTTTTNSCPRGSTIGIGGSGNPSLSTTKAKFGTTSLHYGVNAGFAANSTSTDYRFGTGDWTDECWIYFTAAAPAATSQIIDHRNAGTQVASIIYADSTGAIFFHVNGSNRISSSASVITLNTWLHIASAKASGTTRLFVSGSQVGSNYTDGNNYNVSSLLTIGTNFNGIQPIVNGYIDEVRCTSGVARYTANFTPPIAAFPNS